jgi:hypothetical protein
MGYCSEYLSLNKNCTKLIRDQCNCCTVCLRSESQICGGHLNVYGLCEQDLLCYKTTNNLPEQTGICVKGKEKKKILKYVNKLLFFLACFKYECLLVNRNNKTICECANRRIPCKKTRQYCEQQSVSQQDRQISLLKANDGKLNSIILQ